MMRKFCPMLWDKNLVFAVSRIETEGESNLFRPATPATSILVPGSSFSQKSISNSFREFIRYRYQSNKLMKRHIQVLCLIRVS